MNFNGVAYFLLNDYRIHFWYMNKSAAINMLNNSVLDNNGAL